jgi:16S rRNA (cytosine967-C5)-methyltransferase
MDRVPDAAAVHTAVALARKVNREWATGYINAVLRRALREPQIMAALPPANDPVQRLAVQQSFPAWMISRWKNRWGWPQTEALCRAVNRIPPLALRTNFLTITRGALIDDLKSFAPQIRRSTYSPAGLLIDRLTEGLFDSPPFNAGAFQVQDEAAQAVGYLTAAQPGEFVLDACAGLGGKTAHLAEMMENCGQILAVDRDGRKLERLLTEMQRLGIEIVQTRALDWLGTAAIDLPIRFDRILLDAPCSGMGVLRRNPDAKWKRKPKAFKRYRTAQRKLLARLIPFLKPGGVLVYAVCSTEPEEGTEVLQWFLKNHPQFVIDGLPSSLPAPMAPLFNSDGCLQAEVQRHDTDGFFAARLRKLE